LEGIKLIYFNKVYKEIFSYLSMVDSKLHNTVSFSVESFQVEKVTAAKEKKDGITLTGFALPFDTTSRNGFAYRKESVIKTAETLEGKPFFFNHEIDKVPIGTVEKITVTEKGIDYVAKLKPVTEEGKQVVEGIKAGLIQNVSIQCIYENAKINEESNTFDVDVKEFLELSAVTIPGFAETTAQAHESLMSNFEKKEKVDKLKEKLSKEQAVEEPEEKKMEEQEEPTEDEPVTLESLKEMMDAFVREHTITHEDLDNKVATLQATVDTLVEKEESNPKDEEEQTEESSEEEEEEKTEEKVELEEKSEESIERSTVAPTAEESKKEFNYANWRSERLTAHLNK